MPSLTTSSNTSSNSNYIPLTNNGGYGWSGVGGLTINPNPLDMYQPQPSIIIEKNILCMSEIFPSNLLCNFRTIRFININDFVLSQIDFKKKNFDLKYEIKDTLLSGARYIHISGFLNKDKKYQVVFKLFNANPGSSVDMETLTNFKDAFKYIFEDSAKSDSLCEECVFGPKFFMTNECEEIFETNKID